MDILGIGPLELIFILLIALIVLGPKDMVNAGRTAGRFLRKIVTSPTWNMVQQTSRDLRNLPNTLIREAGLEEEAKQLQEGLSMKDVQADIQKELDGLKEINTDVQTDIQNGLGGLNDLEKSVQVDLSDWTTPIKTDVDQVSNEMDTPIEDQSIVDSTTESEPVIDPRSVDAPTEPSAGDMAADNKTTESQGEA
jgi:Sec-independent protein translocase protein TatA